MVSKRDPGIMDPGITPDERSQRPTPRTEGVGHGVWRYPSARYVEYGVCVRCAHCVLVHTQRTSSAARGDVEWRRSGILGSWDRDEWDHDPGDIQMDEIPGGEILR
jgi:hypothetical protein